MFFYFNIKIYSVSCFISFFIDLNDLNFDLLSCLNIVSVL